MELTDTEAAALRTAHDILVRLGSRAHATLTAIPEDVRLAEITSGDDSSRSSRLYRFEVDAEHGAYDISRVLAEVTEVTEV